MAFTSNKEAVGSVSARGLENHDSSTDLDDATPPRHDSLADKDVPIVNVFSQGNGESFQTMTRWDTVLVLLTNELGLGVLSLPSILHTLGLVPGIIGLVGLGLVSTYTAYELLQFYRAHPHVVSMVGMARVVGGRPLEIIVALGAILKLCMTCGSVTVTLSIAFNSLSNHGMCTLAFSAFATLGCWLLCLPRTFKFVAQVGVPATVSIVAAVLIVIISLGVSGPRGAHPGFHKKIEIIGNPSLKEGLNACLRICYAFAGNVGFVSYMAEMKNPSRDFVPALIILKVIALSFYLVAAIAIYCLAGQYTVSPALGSAPILPAKIAYGIVIPALFATGLVFGHTATKFLYVAAMKAIKSTDQMTDRSVKSWTVWISCASIFWALSFLMANAIPVFDSILSISSATCVAWFAFGISGVFWYHRNWDVKFQRRNIPLATVSALLILQALFMNGAGLWASITGLLDVFHNKKSKVHGAFTCADNSMF